MYYWFWYVIISYILLFFACYYFSHCFSRLIIFSVLTIHRPLRYFWHVIISDALLFLTHYYFWPNVSGICLLLDDYVLLFLVRHYFYRSTIWWFYNSIIFMKLFFYMKKIYLRTARVKIVINIYIIKRIYLFTLHLIEFLKKYPCLIASFTTHYVFFFLNLKKNFLSIFFSKLYSS